MGRKTPETEEQKRQHREQANARNAALDAAGLCRSCRSPRDEANGGTALLCPRCAARRRERYRSKLKPERDARRAAGLCAECGRPRGKKAEAAGWVVCARCHTRQQEAMDKHRRAEREQKAWFHQRGGRKLPLGLAAGRIDGGKKVGLLLDPECQSAMVEMALRDQNEQAGWARAGGKPVEDYARGPLLVRAAILHWKDSPTPCPTRRRRPAWTKPLLDRPQPVPDPGDPDGERMIPAANQRFLGPSVKVTLLLDPECFRIVERDAAELYRGNRSEAIRAMIAYQRRDAPELMRHLRVLAPPTTAERLAGMSRRNPRFCDTEPGDDPYWHDGERASLWDRW